MRIQHTKSITIAGRVWDDMVDCPVCCKEISLRVAWFDPYCKTHVWDKIKDSGKGAQVCHDCLSQTRKLEIEKEIEAMRNKE